MLRPLFVLTLLSLALSGAAVSDERLVTIEPDDNIPYNSEIVVTISGWPTDCPSVELAYLDGSVGDPGSGEVVGSWGIFELSEGATQVTVPTPPQPEEYNLRVAGTIPECGEPYYSPDFFVLGSGDVDIDVNYTDETATFDASNWSPNCSTLDVTWSGPWADEFPNPDETELPEIPGIDPQDWPWEKIALTDGSGTATGPLPMLLDVPSYWEVTVSGDPERCGAPVRREIHLDKPPPAPPPITVVTSPGTTTPGDAPQPGDPTLAANASCRDEDGTITVSIHDPELESYFVVISPRSEGSVPSASPWEIEIAVTVPDPVAFTFGPIPNGDYEVVVEPAEDRATELLITSVTVICPQQAPSATTTSTSPSAPLPETGASGQTSAVLVLGLLFVSFGAALLTVRRL